MVKCKNRPLRSAVGHIFFFFFLINVQLTAVTYRLISHSYKTPCLDKKNIYRQNYPNIAKNNNCDPVHQVLGVFLNALN